MSWEFLPVAGSYGSPIDGPVWDGEALLFTQLTFPFNAANNRILRYDPQTGAATDFRRWTNRTTGLAFSNDGVLFGCQSGGRRLVRFNADGSTSPLAHKLDGVYHNQPKDLVVDRQNRIWFCDPHGDLRRAMNPQIHDKLDHASILRLEAPNLEAPNLEAPNLEVPNLEAPNLDSTIRRMTYDTDAPAALAFAPNEDYLYVSESSEAPDGVRELRAYPVLEDGTLGPYRLLHTFGADRRGIHQGISGMCLDGEGNIVAVAGREGSGPGPMVYVFSPEGRILESRPVPASPTNCAFGGPDRSDLYVTTTGGYLYRAVATGRQGRP